jgi:hypothetical protein
MGRPAELISIVNGSAQIDEYITYWLAGPRIINANANGWARNNQFALGMGQPRLSNILPADWLGPE